MPDFLANAPEDVVDREKPKKDDYEERIERSTRTSNSFSAGNKASSANRRPPAYADGRFFGPSADKVVTDCFRADKNKRPS